jgi:hypothetical protein
MPIVLATISLTQMWCQACSYDMGWFDGDTTNANTTTEAWDITSQHGTREQEVVHRPAPEVSPPKGAVIPLPQVAPPVAPPAAPHKNAVIHEATRAGVGVIILVDVPWHVQASSRIPRHYGYGNPHRLRVPGTTLLHPSRARWSCDDHHTQAEMQALYGTTVSPHVWDIYARHHGLNVATNERWTQWYTCCWC